MMSISAPAMAVDNSSAGKTESNLMAVIHGKLSNTDIILNENDQAVIEADEPEEKAVVEDESSMVTEGLEDEMEEKPSNLIEINEPETLPVVEKPDDAAEEFLMIPVLERNGNTALPSNVAVPRKRVPLPTPNLDGRPIVLATHLVPSLPVSLFEILGEAIEAATGKPVVLLHETRPDRPVAKEVTDIAILPACNDWDDGKLLPVTFVFEHRLNKDKTGGVYADLVVTTDRAPFVKEITDLRGHRCALPDRQKNISTAELLFNQLHSRGESPAFFGNILDAGSQIEALRMVAGKQAEVGILEAPVIKCHKYTMAGVESLQILTSFGPLPPYRIMANKTLTDELVEKISSFLLNIHKEEDWLDRLKPYGISGFVENSVALYDLGRKKLVVTSVPYY